jgi:hypothetical protein
VTFPTGDAFNDTSAPAGASCSTCRSPRSLSSSTSHSEVTRTGFLFIVEVQLTLEGGVAQ